ncbi:MAG: UDP-N-acetylmuramoyl-L-alanine--D-glutamate ligase [Desulfobacca sp.]|nr:UDP-N-acetylmuramoyl-L-alanine--D-glutamate ligase [Desulfobacca sp.]
MKLAGKKILVVGLGQTGVGLCKFLSPRGAHVTVTDAAPAAALGPVIDEIKDLVTGLALGQAYPPHLEAVDLIILSPGVPPELPWLQRAVAAGIPLMGELELASRFLQVPVVAISGTNGKTTTTELVGELLRASGRRVRVGGNIGTPLIELLQDQDQLDYLVIEVSSFQLDTAWSFKPQAATLLNISADHLDRYASFAAYVNSKASLFRLQGPEDLAVLNADDPLVAPLAAQLRSRVCQFSSQQPVKTGAWRMGGALYIRLASGLEAQFPVADIKLGGQHNLENIMAALLLALNLGATPQDCREVLARYPGLPHRLEWVATLAGVRFFDDSKGTNVGAVTRSLANFTDPVILIAGGRDKGGDYGPLAPLVQERVKAMILIGEARDQMAATLGHLAHTRLADDLPQAVQWAWEESQPGDVILLSPACSSFDMFKDYAERGQVFQAAVRGLSNGRPSRASSQKSV